MDLCPKVIWVDHPIIGSVDFCLRDVDRIVSSLELCPKVKGIDHPVIESCVLQVQYFHTDDMVDLVFLY